MIKATLPDLGLTVRLLNTNNSEYRKLEVSGGTARLRKSLLNTLRFGYGKYGHLVRADFLLPEDFFIVLSQNNIRYVIDESSEKVESFNVPKGAIP